MSHPNTTRRPPFTAILAWLLQLDRPIPALTEDELTAQVERDYNRNFVVNLLDGTLFSFGASFMSAATILPLFLTKVTDHPLAFGLLAVIAQAGWFLPQLFTANLMERLARKKPVVVNLGFFSERVPVGMLVLAALAAGRWPTLGAVLMLLALAWHVFGAGVVAVSWQDLLARMFPVEQRGRFLGVTMFIGAGMGAAGAALSAWLLRRFAFPLNFAYVFSIATVAMLLSWAFLALAREPVQPVRTPRRSNRAYLAELPHLVRSDQNFRRYIITRAVLALGGMGNGFITVAAVSRWQVSDGTVGLFTLMALIGQTIGNLTFGMLADRYGHKLSLQIGAAVAVLAFGLAAFAPTPVWYFAVFGLNGIVSGAIIVSGILIVMEFSAPERRPTYVGIANTGVGLVGVIAPLLGAALAGGSYRTLFMVSALVNLLASGLFWRWVREPRHASAREEL
jgi:MFS family permease